MYYKAIGISCQQLLSAGRYILPMSENIFNGTGSASNTNTSHDEEKWNTNDRKNTNREPENSCPLIILVFLTPSIPIGDINDSVQNCKNYCNSCKHYR